MDQNHVVDLPSVGFCDAFSSVGALRRWAEEIVK